MKYNLRYSQLAKKDMEDIIFYISHQLKSKKAAIKLEKEFIKQEHNIITLPYGASIYVASSTLEFEYRRVIARNFQMFYTIDEDKKIIMVMRVLYEKRDFDSLLK